ncbi:hypothetical protein VKT23_000917 [Stygiomarasmius scandens]|uniref:Transglutaminase-like domain-containing protein n=1 Tax=Marasmiellus scandens TaxID=2682957 RepID=A0ABR1K7Y8_9AGAR
MSATRPPAPPPRRSVPPPPRNADPEETQPAGIAVRIANLQLNHIGRSPSQTKIPIVRSEDKQSASLRSRRPTWEELEARGPEYVRALKRRPPNPPGSSPPPVPNRPPKPVRLPTPPEPEPELETVDHHAVDHQEPDTCLRCHDFSFVDDHAAQFPRETVSSLDQLAYDLTAPWQSETEKFRAIFTWMHHNIAYDAVAFLSGNIRAQSPDIVFRSGLAVCDGYAQLCVALAEKAGLQAIKVSGHGKGYGYVDTGPEAPLPAFGSNHAWNCIFDGEWRLIDCCWGAGVLEGSSFKKSFNPSWFTSSSVEFGKKHYPEDPGYQLIADEDGGPVSWRDYILSPETPVIFNGLYELNFSPHFVQPDYKYIQSGTWVTFHIFKWCPHMSTDEAENYVHFLVTPDDKRIPMTVNSEGGWSAQVYIPRGSGEVSLCYLTVLDGRDAKGFSIQTFGNSIGRKSMAWAGMCRWTVI